jgi:hypothetical protein
LGGLFFFSNFTAPEAPIVGFLSQYASIAFGQQGLWVFFTLCVIMGMLIMLKGHLMKTLVKQFILLMFVISGVVNFSIMQEGNLIGGIVNWGASRQYGGYVSRPLIEGLAWVFGDSLMAIKILIVLIALAILAWMLYALNVKLPSLPKIDVAHYNQPEKKSASSSSSVPSITKESKTTSDTELREKVIQATGTAFGRTEIGTKKIETEKGGSLLKDLLKKKLATKLDSSSSPVEESKPRRQIHFSGDKPTFPYSLLESNFGQTQNIDQNFIVEKAKSLEKKLMEFGIPVSIEGFDI